MIVKLSLKKIKYIYEKLASFVISGYSLWLILTKTLEMKGRCSSQCKSIIVVSNLILFKRLFYRQDIMLEYMGLRNKHSQKHLVEYSTNWSFMKKI